ncbi:MAG TPA: hypothetical protein VJA21_28990 [Verrucomicrobiae bacterium]
MNQTPEGTSETPPRAPAKFFTWRSLLFAVACFATLIALAYAEENWRGRRAWQAHCRQWEAKGEKLALAAVIPPPVPDDKNFALAPLLKPLLDLKQGPTGVVWRDTNGLERFGRFSALLIPKDGSKEALALGSLEKGTFADVASWAERYRRDTNSPAAGTGGSPAEAVLCALRQLDPDFSELREAAVSRPYSRFPVQYEAEPPFGVLLPHLGRLKPMATLLQVRATAELAGGLPMDAYQDVKLGLRISDSIRDEPIIISHLVRAATLGSVLQTVREGLRRHAWTDAQLAELQGSLASVNLLAEYKVAMRGERAGTVAELDYLRRHGNWGLDVEEFFSKGITSCERVLRFGPSGWIYQNMLTVSRICQEFTLPAVDEQAHRVSPEIAARAKRMLQASHGPYTLFSRLFQPSLEKVIQRSARMQSFVDAARVACALERYRLANNDLPDTLAALTPRFLERVPTDVIDGQSLRWRRVPAGGYVIYSVGWNQTDDGGAPGWNPADDSGIFGLLKEKHGAWVDPAKGDWAWVMPAD